MKMQVLMSVYNGERYLARQLESILVQEGPDLTIIIRDDGSEDSTAAMIEAYAGLDSRIRLIRGAHVGAGRSYLYLIEQADGADYYAFADQDDIWLPGKLKAAQMALEGIRGETVRLYCGALSMVDEKLRPLRVTVDSPVVRPSFGNAIVQNICTGCTCVASWGLVEQIQGRIPEYTVMYDWWLYLTAACLGRILYDPQSYILYRRHTGTVSRQLREFVSIYPLEGEKKVLAQTLLQSQNSFTGRWRAVMEPGIYRQRFSDTVILRLIILAGRL